MANNFQIPDPHSTFRFLVEIDGVDQAVFTECKLPDIEWETQEIKEGGLNTYTHLLPGRRKAHKVSLKNGLAKGALMDWYKTQMGGSFENQRKSVSITLLDVTHQPVVRWNMKNALPIKWSGPDLKTADNAVAIQTLELVCNEVTIE